MKKLSIIVLLFIVNTLIFAQNEELNPRITAEEIQDHISDCSMLQVRSSEHRARNMPR